MTDKERILLCLVNSIYRRALYAPRDRYTWLDMQPGFITGQNPLQPGDLVTASTTIIPNEWMVGYVHEVKPDRVVIREIGSDRLCDYYNESFYRIDKELLGYDILEGVQYQTFRKVEQAFGETTFSYSFRFKGISFDGDTCKVEARKVFENDTVFVIEFQYESGTTIESITELLNHAERKCRGEEDTNA